MDDDDDGGGLATVVMLSILTKAMLDLFRTQDQCTDSERR
jgi:hypothetical protein